MRLRSVLVKKRKMRKKKHKEDIYTHIPIEHLILLGIYLVIEKGETCTFENLVAECFHQFPKVFSFKRYPQWPDSLKFDRPLEPPPF